MKMKQKLSLIVALVAVLLAGCAQEKSKTSASSSSHQESSTSAATKKEQTLKFVVAPQYEGKTSELIEYGRKLTQEHPEVGKQGEVTLYYTGSTYTLDQQEYAVFMLVNKTSEDLNRDAQFKITWSYDGQYIYQNQLVGYSISENGTLPSQSATVFLLPLTEEQQDVVKNIAIESKMKLSISDIVMK